MINANIYNFNVILNWYQRENQTKPKPETNLKTKNKWSFDYIRPFTTFPVRTSKTRNFADKFKFKL